MLKWLINKRMLNFYYSLKLFRLTSYTASIENTKLLKIMMMKLMVVIVIVLYCVSHVNQCRKKILNNNLAHTSLFLPITPQNFYFISLSIVFFLFLWVWMFHERKKERNRKLLSLLSIDCERHTKQKEINIKYNNNKNKENWVSRQGIKVFSIHYTKLRYCLWLVVQNTAQRNSNSRQPTAMDHGWWRLKQ